MRDFSSLLELAKAGDRAALEELYERYARPITGAIRRRLSFPLRRRFDTLDLAHSVFAEVLRDLPRFTDQGEPAFRGWLDLKVRSKVGMKLRKHLGCDGGRIERGLEAALEPAQGGATPPSEAAEAEDADRARSLLGLLPEEERRLVMLRIEEELSFAEIADRLNLPSADAARKRYARSIAGMRRQAEREAGISDRRPPPRRQV